MPNYGLVYQQVEAFKRGVLQVMQSLHLQLSGEAIRTKAIEQILIDKKIMTDEDLKKKMADVIKDLNSQKQETVKKQKEEKKELIKPTVGEVAKVDGTKDIKQPKKSK